MLFANRKSFSTICADKREPIAMDLHPIPPSPCATSQPGVRPRSRPSRLAMSYALSLPLLAAASASPRALQSSCSCNLGRQLLGDMLLGAACICATGILNAGRRLPGLCALQCTMQPCLCACGLPVGSQARPVCTCKRGAARRSASVLF